MMNNDYSHAGYYNFYEDCFKKGKEEHIRYKLFLDKTLGHFLSDKEYWDLFGETVNRITITKEGLEFTLIYEEKPFKFPMKNFTDVSNLFYSDIIFRMRNAFNKLSEMRGERSLTYNMRLLEHSIEVISSRLFWLSFGGSLLYCFLQGVDWKPILLIIASILFLYVWEFSVTASKWIDANAKEKHQYYKEKRIEKIVFFDFEIQGKK